jgi:hypothetical protein
MAYNVENRLLLILQHAVCMQAARVHYALKVNDKTSMQAWL